MLSYIIYTDKYTYLVRAKRGEKIYCIMCTTLLCILVTISLNLFSCIPSLYVMVYTRR